MFKKAGVLVTGGAGFIGSHLVRALRARGAVVHLLVRRDTSLARLADIRGALTMHRGDLRDARAVARALEKSSPRWVFNLAMPYGHPKTGPERRAMLDQGVLGLFNLLESAQSGGLRAFIHAGSSLEYGRSGRPLSESAPVRPASFRGLVKAAQAQLCRQYAEESGLPVRILRPFSVYGPQEAESRFIPTLMRAARCGGEVVLTGGEVRHDFIFVQDVVAAFLLACRDRGAGLQEYNIGTGREYRNAEVAALVQRVSGRELRIARRLRPPEAHDRAHWVADGSRAAARLGFKPGFSLEQGLRQTWAWTARTAPEPAP